MTDRTPTNNGPLSSLDLALAKVATAKRNLEFARAYSSNWPEAEYQLLLAAREELRLERASVRSSSSPLREEEDPQGQESSV